MLRDNQTLLDIARCARLILQFKEGIDKTTFLNDVEKQSAILYQFAILGEAVKRLSWEFRGQHPEVPWSSIAGMGDKIMHDYEEINLERIGNTVENKITDLLAAIAPLLPQESQ